MNTKKLKQQVKAKMILFRQRGRIKKSAQIRFQKVTFRERKTNVLIVQRKIVNWSVVVGVGFNLIRPAVKSVGKRVMKRRILKTKGNERSTSSSSSLPMCECMCEREDSLQLKLQVRGVCVKYNHSAIVCRL